MKLICKGKFDGNPESLPHGEHRPGAVIFKEPETPKRLSVIANVIALALTVIFVVLLFLRGGIRAYRFIGLILALLSMLPHELLHAICFKNEVYLYTNLKQGMLFIIGLEDMSKASFVFMALLPNIVFGFLPFILFLIFPQLGILGTLGAFAIGMGAGDYINVYNALTQMPKGARTYMYQFNSYWYMPEPSGLQD